MNNSQSSTNGVVIGENNLFFFVNCTPYGKIIKYKLSKNTLPSSLKLNIGDSIRYELTANSVKTKVELCNIQLINKGEYTYVLDCVTSMEANLVSYTESQVMGLLVNNAESVNPDSWPKYFKEKLGLELLGKARSFTTGGENIFEPLLIFKKV
jgi:hypothetical protein